MALLVMTYHHVEGHGGEEPAGAVTVEALVAQLERVGRSFDFVSRDELLAAQAAGTALPSHCCLVTFDDGLRSQFEHALPILERLGVPALFFVPGAPLEEGRALDVHKVQWLRSRTSDRRLLELLASELPDAASHGDPAEAIAAYPYDDAEPAALKFALNHALPASAASELVNRMFRRHGGDDRALCAELYMDGAQVRELERRHGAVGGHGYDHRRPDRLTEAELRLDLSRARDALSRVTGAPPRVLSYPHGSRKAVTSRSTRVAAACGYRLAFTTEPRLNTSLSEPLGLGRFDTNRAPGGPLHDPSLVALGRSGADGPEQLQR